MCVSAASSPTVRKCNIGNERAGKKQEQSTKAKPNKRKEGSQNQMCTTRRARDNFQTCKQHDVTQNANMQEGKKNETDIHLHNT